jgi:hypothetical protein
MHTHAYTRVLPHACIQTHTHAYARYHTHAYTCRANQINVDENLKINVGRSLNGNCRGETHFDYSRHPITAFFKQKANQSNARFAMDQSAGDEEHDNFISRESHIRHRIKTNIPSKVPIQSSFARLHGHPVGVMLLNRAVPQKALGLLTPNELQLVARPLVSRV